jgi:uncharacterized protein YbcI
MTEPNQATGQESTHEVIAREILNVQKQAYGTGAEAVEVTIDENLVVVVIEPELATSEKTLLEAGYGEAVRTTREAFQGAIQPTFQAIVERATGRTVAAFMSTMSIDPLYAVELFRLAPQTGS